MMPLGRMEAKKQMTVYFQNNGGAKTPLVGVLDMSVNLLPAISQRKKMFADIEMTVRRDSPAHKMWCEADKSNAYIRLWTEDGKDHGTWFVKKPPSKSGRCCVTLGYSS